MESMEQRLHSRFDSLVDKKSREQDLLLQREALQTQLALVESKLTAQRIANAAGEKAIVTAFPMPFVLDFVERHPEFSGVLS